MLVINSFMFFTFLLVCECKLSTFQRESITSSINNQKEITSKLEGLLANPTGFHQYVSFGRKTFEFASTAFPMVANIYQGVGFIDQLINGPKDDPLMKEFRKIEENFRQLDKKLDSLEKV